VVRFWFVGVDTARLRPALHGRARAHVLREFAAVARSFGARVIACASTPFGIRALVSVQSRSGARTLVRRFCATSARWFASTPAWRSRAMVGPVLPSEVESCIVFIRRCALAFPEEKPTLRTGNKKNGAAATRRAAGLMRDIETAVDQLLGADETARRCRTYVAQHDAPADDPAAYARLCAVIFAQGLGFGAVEAKHEQFFEAFDGFRPEAVAAFDDERIAVALQAPIIRNEAKIRACVENARRWVAAAGAATYLGNVARIAADDDAACGWPRLTQQLQGDFARIGETAARQTLKRWGFFTAFAHPGCRRALERLELIRPDATPAAVQCLLGSVARVAGRDPYHLEATLALFASLGPCKREPECESCTLLDKCPAGAKRIAAAGQIA
jgi:3-methyladenine DNA glycosylase Tag